MSSNGSGAAASGGAIYGLGIFGAWVFFWQQADTFWEYVLAVLEGLLLWTGSVSAHHALHAVANPYVRHFMPDDAALRLFARAAEKEKDGSADDAAD